MTNEEQAAALLPCCHDELLPGIPIGHSKGCPLPYRPAVASALAEKDSQLNDLYAERGHWCAAAASIGQSDGHGWAEETKALRKRVAALEQQVRVLENPRITNEDWHKMALMYQERVAELEAIIVNLEVERRRYRDHMEKQVAAAKGK